MIISKPTRRTVPDAEPRQVTTRAKSGSKRRKTSEPDIDLFDIEKRLHDVLTEEFSRLKVHHEKRIAEYEETLTRIRSAAAAKDKTITNLEKDKQDLEAQLLHSEMGIHEAAMNATDEAKVCAARAILQDRIEMAQEAMDSSFDRATWEVASWEMEQKNLGGDEELEQAAVDAGEAGTSGVPTTEGCW
ncbi:hypothetical protein HanRHA438_Chr08g0367941 [Helianthus annuus]|nr:uncharacterized protein LOC110871534 isoform X2 [Helianthus annuus]KAJ0540049.1 hypothetical protein HanHA300_Chr08g0293771 [Helianthus annuus]KAJ0548456.1 hypothetical protein HanIR_Chr08g0384011 [Helianthus annuus]KAJ0554789.1 hypothetical protein HanHA89_Chr08g0312251 [Helianthus annuus]KAJ0720357.1 hypothetical protein HanLR1_Chr08g0292601 [Helianthus annuus]KAJ0723567.1 hypothetical protein HanOQP8_Chr08g0299901 [Helianthus annuus]